MHLRHLAIYLLLNSVFSICVSMSKRTFTPVKGQQLLETVVNLTDSLIELTPYLNSSLAEIPSNCVQILCKFACFNGLATDIEVDILTVSKKNNHFCSHIEELRLYNYVFRGDKLPLGFLGHYSDKVKILYLASSNITDIEAGVFAKGPFKEIYFENLQLKELKRDFFKGIPKTFDTLSIIQTQMPIETVNTDFLYNIKLRIKSLTLQAGLKSISNLTGGDILLNNLVHIDFSHNDLGSRMEASALSQVSRLERLDLSNSNLEFIQPYLFFGFTNTLEYLDLSYNKLKTISRDMFGWQEIPHELKIYAEDNRWSCSCDLQQEIRFIKLQYRTPLVCTEPDIYQGFSLFDDEICGVKVISLESQSSEEEASLRISTITKEEEEEYVHIPTQTTELPSNKTSSNSTPPEYGLPSELIKLNCLTNRFKRHETTEHFLCRPRIVFNLIARESHHVDVIVESSEQPYDAFGLVWFSKVTSKYYKMEINYNEYGLGCYKNISAVTSVSGLRSNTAYTFCIVLKHQSFVSPFNCRSIHVGNNLETKTSAWLTRDMKITGLILFIFGIIMFLLAGILMMYLLLKHKCILLKRNRRVTTLNSSEDKQQSSRPIKEQHEKLGRCGRRNSTASEISYESYINANVYEVIPALEELNKKTDNGLKPPPAPTTLSVYNNEDTDSCYLTPLESITTAGNFIQYADIPRLSTENSQDVLPQLPAEVPPLSTNKADYARVGNVYFLDSHV